MVAVVVWSYLLVKEVTCGGSGGGVFGYQSVNALRYSESYPWHLAHHICG